MDLGQKRDFTAFCVVERRVEMFNVKDPVRRYVDLVICADSRAADIHTHRVIEFASFDEYSIRGGGAAHRQAVKAFKVERESEGSDGPAIAAGSLTIALPISLTGYYINATIVLVHNPL